MAGLDVSWLRSNATRILDHERPLMREIDGHLKKALTGVYDDEEWQKRAAYFCHCLSEVYSRCYAVVHGEESNWPGLTMSDCIEMMGCVRSAEIARDAAIWDLEKESEDLSCPLVLLPQFCTAPRAGADESVKTGDFLVWLYSEYIKAFEELFAAQRPEEAILAVLACTGIISRIMCVIEGARIKAISK